MAQRRTRPFCSRYTAWILAQEAVCRPKQTTHSSIAGGLAPCTKDHHAWVCGAMPTSRGTARLAIDGKDSCTAFKTLGTRTWGVHGHATLVEWELFTGRTHQIRRHAAAMGHPVVGDLAYGSPPHYTGHGLHLTCTRLRWLHPNTKEAIEVSVAPAKKMIRAVPGQFEPVANARSEWLPLFAPASRS